MEEKFLLWLAAQVALNRIFPPLKLKRVALLVVAIAHVPQAPSNIHTMEIALLGEPSYSCFRKTYLLLQLKPPSPNAVQRAHTAPLTQTHNSFGEGMSSGIKSAARYAPQGFIQPLALEIASSCVLQELGLTQQATEIFMKYTYTTAV